MSHLPLTLQRGQAAKTLLVAASLELFKVFKHYWVFKHVLWQSKILQLTQKARVTVSRKGTV